MRTHAPFFPIEILKLYSPSGAGTATVDEYNEGGQLIRTNTVTLPDSTVVPAGTIFPDGVPHSAVIRPNVDVYLEHNANDSSTPSGAWRVSADSEYYVGKLFSSGGGSGSVGVAGVGSKTDPAETDPTAEASLISVVKGSLPLGPVEPTVVTLTASGQDIVPTLAGAGRRWYGTIQWQSTSLDDETTLEWSNDAGTTWHKVMMVSGYAVCIAHSDTNSKVQVRYDTSKTASGDIKAVGYFELTGV